MRRLTRPWNVRTLMIAVACTAAPLSVAASIHHRAENFRQRERYHSHAAIQLLAETGVVLHCSFGLTEADLERIHCERGPVARRAYRACLYHRALAKKYRNAAEQPWRHIAADPPAPPGAYPKLEPIEFEEEPLQPIPSEKPLQ